ncbi:L,D-transpeptidase family protein [Zavarzinia sp.]|uniref:L,D-transpeptidase family protein n=1 Tax=Zavarzinia sp. TaxID=2027920 RepID=UPI003BB62C08
MTEEDDIEVFPDGTARFAGRAFAVSLGRAGMVVDKHEGDGGTPVGTWPLRRVLYRPDRLAAPACALPVTAIAMDDGWCDAPDHPAYNRPVRLPFPASHEVMWREDHLYDLVLVVGHNDDPPVPGRGSAIFLHPKRPDEGPTAGCIAFEPGDFLWLLAHLSPDSRLVTHAGA